MITQRRTLLSNSHQSINATPVKLTELPISVCTRTKNGQQTFHHFHNQCHALFRYMSYTDSLLQLDISSKSIICLQLQNTQILTNSTLYLPAPHCPDHPLGLLLNLGSYRIPAPQPISTNLPAIYPILNSSRSCAVWYTLLKVFQGTKCSIFVNSYFQIVTPLKRQSQ